MPIVYYVFLKRRDLMKIYFSYFKLLSCIALIFFTACATIPKLEVAYNTTPKSNILEGKEIYFAFIDKRANKDIIGNGAKRIYKNFSGNINYILSKGEKERFLVGIYDIKTFFKKTFTLYLENMGLQLVPERKEGIPELAINLYDFTLDLPGRSWIARIDYEAEFTQEGNVLTRRFKGQAEKLRIAGIKQAHQVMSETFNDVVHKLDVKGLFTDISK
jgi:ribosomal protein L23